MGYQFFTISEYVNEEHHISASEKIIRGRTDFHVHEFFEIEFVVDGAGKHIVNGQEYDLSKSDIYLLTPGTFHKLVCDPELKLVNIMFDESVIATAEYGANLTAAVQNKNVFGCQFHPEKSGAVGLNILKAFCEME